LLDGRDTGPIDFFLTDLSCQIGKKKKWLLSLFPAKQNNDM
jgi:hypothetical protein